MSCYVAQSVMELTILLIQPPEDWDYGLAPARLILHYFLCFISFFSLHVLLNYSKGEPYFYSALFHANQSMFGS